MYITYNRFDIITVIVLKMEETEGKKITIDLSRGGDTTERVENVILMSKRPYLTQ